MVEYGCCCSCWHPELLGGGRVSLVWGWVAFNPCKQCPSKEVGRAGVAVGSGVCGVCRQVAGNIQQQGVAGVYGAAAQACAVAVVVGRQVCCFFHGNGGGCLCAERGVQGRSSRQRQCGQEGVWAPCQCPEPGGMARVCVRARARKGLGPISN